MLTRAAVVWWVSLWSVAFCFRRPAWQRPTGKRACNFLHVKGPSRSSCSAAGFTEWTYKRDASDFIVIEDRVLYAPSPPPPPPATALLPPPPAADTPAALTADFLRGKLTAEQYVQLEQLAVEALAATDSSATTGLSSLLLSIDPPLSKEERTTFHRTVGACFPSLDSKTEIQPPNSPAAPADVAVVVRPTVIRIYPKRAKSLAGKDGEGEAQGDGKRRSKVVVNQRWDRSKPDYVHFTVVKRQLSHAEMVARLAQLTSYLPSRFEHCGSKDKVRPP